MTVAATNAIQRSTVWVTSLGKGLLENWVIVKESGLWGSPRPNARNVRRGDELFVWRTSRAG